MRMAAICAAAALAVAGPAGAQEGDARLTVIVTGVDAGVGRVMAGLFDSAANYDAAMDSQGGTDPFRSGEAVVDANSRATLVFDGLAPGDYAVSVHYDRDGDGEMNTGVFGIPREKVGFSNDASGSFGAPAWEDARIDVGAGGAEIAVRVKSVGF